MNEQNAQRFARLINEAAASLGAGFATATAKKEANTSVSRAYEILKDAVFSALLAASRDAYSDEAMDLPYELRHVKTEKFMAVAALVGYEVGNNLQVLQDMRAAIAECPVVKKVKEVKTVADASKGERIQYRGICQVCGHEQAVVNGRMSKHGYNVKFGFFNGVCSGEHYEPMQVSINQSEKIIEKCEIEAVACELRAEKLETGKAVLEFVTRGYGKEAPVVPYAECPVYEQRQARESAVWGLRSEARQYRNHAECLTRLVAEYFGKELRPVVVC